MPVTMNTIVPVGTADAPWVTVAVKVTGAPVTAPDDSVTAVLVVVAALAGAANNAIPARTRADPTPSRRGPAPNFLAVCLIRLDASVVPNPAPFECRAPPFVSEFRCRQDGMKFARPPAPTMGRRQPPMQTVVGHIVDNFQLGTAAPAHPLSRRAERDRVFRCSPEIVWDWRRLERSVSEGCVRANSASELEPERRFELLTCALRVRCSTD